MERIAVIGLGYVGLPVALALARAFDDVVGFDVDARRVAELGASHDRTGEAEPGALAATLLRVVADPAALADRTFFVVAVPTPIDAQRRPDLRALLSASTTVGRALAPGAVVVYESTVYPGVTEGVCGPALEAASGLVRGRDFTVGYSPERINPGDRDHRLETIVKVVAGEDAATLERIAAVYGAVVEPGVFRARSIAVAEAAKVIENTQRDLNIALMNELSMIFERLGLRTADVLAAARTKWNFLPFHPGLVGGHCIGVDPYYLTARAEEVGYHPEVILAGRRINDAMGRHVARRVVRALNRAGVAGAAATVGVLGLTFKEDVPDLRNSKVADVVEELADHGVTVLVHDPVIDPEDYPGTLTPLERLTHLDALVLAVPHRALVALGARDLCARVATSGVLFDLRGRLDPAEVAALRPDLTLLSL